MFDVQIYLKKMNANTAALQVLLSIPNVDFNFKKAAEAWSILEIVEHIYKVELGVYRSINKPTELYSDTPTIIGEEKLNRIIIDMRARKTKVPEGFAPSGIFTNVTFAIENFLNLRNKWQTNFNENKINIDNRIVVHPYLGNMTIIDWLYFLLAHSQRHYLQIEEIIQHQNIKKHENNIT
jgi:DinB superfamily